MQMQFMALIHQKMLKLKLITFLAKYLIGQLTRV
jgi:hypothetical protein